LAARQHRRRHSTVPPAVRQGEREMDAENELRLKIYIGMCAVFAVAFLVWLGSHLTFQ
jgi:hypothetical protein